MMQEFKVGDWIQKKDGTPFSGGRDVVQVIATSGPSGALIRLDGGSFIKSAVVELATQAGAAGLPSSDYHSKKADQGKTQWSLLLEGCSKAIEGVANILTIAVKPKDQGGRGYVPHSWKEVPEARRRYNDALDRHRAAIRRGERYDNGPEGTGQLHSALVATNALFLAELDAMEDNK